MPKKIRELKAMLRKAGFTVRSTRGSHITWKHSKVSGTVTISGNDGDDAQRYQENEVKRILEKLREVQHE